MKRGYFRKFFPTPLIFNEQMYILDKLINFKLVRKFVLSNQIYLTRYVIQKLFHIVCLYIYNYWIEIYSALPVDGPTWRVSIFYLIFLSTDYLAVFTYIVNYMNTVCMHAPHGGTDASRMEAILTIIIIIIINWVFIFNHENIPRHSKQLRDKFLDVMTVTQLFTTKNQSVLLTELCIKGNYR